MTAQRDTVYWYAPFDNAGELSLARATSSKLSGSLVVQSVSSRFGEDLPGGAGEPFTLVRDLPPPAGENSEPRSRRRRLDVARERVARRRQLIAASMPSLIHLHTYNPVTDWYDAPRLSRRGVPVIQSIHNVRPHDRQLPASVETLLLRRGYRSFDRVIVAHEHLAARLVDEFGVDDERIDVVPLPIITDDFQVTTRPAKAGEVTTFLLFGTLRQNKGIGGYLEAIRSLRGESSMRFVVAGRGDPDLESLVKHQAASDSRIAAEIGFISSERRAELYSSADVVVMPYTDLPAQSGVLQDAYASRRPVIATNVGALGPTIESDGTGWVVPARDTGALARALRYASASPEERQRRAVLAGAIVDSRSPALVADQLLAVYDRAMTPLSRGRVR